MNQRLRMSFLLLLLTTSCNDYTVRTVINPDGSFQRTVNCVGDSLGLYELRLPYNFSDGWEVNIKRNPDSSASQYKYFGTAQKTYADIEQFRKEMEQKRDSTTVNVSCTIEKRFRWFYTYYDYRETVHSYGLFKYLPVDSFFTPVERRALLAEPDSILKERYELFFIRNILEEFVQSLLPRIRELNDPALSPSMVLEKKEQLLERIIKWEGDLDPVRVMRLLEEVFETRAVRKLEREVARLYDGIEAKIKRESEMELSYKNEVTMPGMLIESNSDKVEGNKVSWDCKSDRYLDYAMYAESRMVNLWAIIITAVVCVILLIGLLIPLLRTKKG